MRADRLDRILIGGRRRFGVFTAKWRFGWFTIPLSRKRIIAGCLLVIFPALGEFVIPSLLGGSGRL